VCTSNPQKQERTLEDVKLPEGLTPEDLLRMYRTMVTSRRLDDREISLKRQNKIFFQISGAGHEGIQVALAAHLRPGHDWFHFYYRDRAFSLALGLSPLAMLLQAAGAADDPQGGGRQMPCHFTSTEIQIASASSPTGTQFLQAVGMAEAGYRATMLPELKEFVTNPREDEIVVVTTGDGTTSQGEFWEALNTATNLSLPVLFLVEDNNYAISVPVEVQTPAGSISRVLAGYPNLYVRECDGTDVLDSFQVGREVVDHVRSRRGPALLHAHVIRPYSHSMSDDERMYRTQEERAMQAERDPLTRTRALILELGVGRQENLDALEAEVEAEVAAAADEALTHPQPAPETALRHLYSEEVDPTSPEFDSEDSPQYVKGAPLLTMVDLLNACMKDEMARDPRIVVFGEDVADASRAEALREVKGKGGVFKVTHGLQGEFGGERVFNSPLAEANIVGRAIGMAIRGLRPVVEIQFFDYIWTAFMQLRDELAMIRYRSNGTFSAPVVVRVTYGGYLKGGGMYHSQTGETLFTHMPGVRVVLPSTAEDANGLLRTAIRCEDPVIFLEHKHLYRQVYNKGRNPGPDFMIPLGKAKVARPGSDITVITAGALVKRSLDAAKLASEEHGVEAEIIDLRTLNPLDMETIATSVKRTNKALIVHEDSLSWGLGSEISARIADELFPWLDGPVRRVGSLDTWVAYAPRLEEAILPQTSGVLKAMLELASY
jgi:2-oxoisovalerate dehydrogenase E1 component